MRIVHRSKTWSRRRASFCWGVVLLALCGCGTLWDTVTSRDFRPKDLWNKPDPMTVLRDSTDGAKRGWALAQLKEPAQHGGTKEQQEFYMKILTEAALNDREPLCRIGAIRSLSDYKDARAAEVLRDAFYGKTPFTPEITGRIKMQALAALEKTGTAIAKDVLIKAADQPSHGKTASMEDALQTNDERLTAIRGLARFHSLDAAEALVKVLEKDKDVAVKDRAQQSLRAITGKNLPPDAVAWREYLQKTPSEQFAREPSILQKLMVNPFGN